MKRTHNQKEVTNKDDDNDNDNDNNGQQGGRGQGCWMSMMADNEGG